MSDPLLSLQTLTSIVQSMAEGIAVEDTSGCFTFVNPACARLLGYTQDELIGQHWTAIIPPDQHEHVLAANQRRWAGGADHYEVELLCKGGGRLSVWVSGTPLFEEGQFAGTVAVFSDITARKLVEVAEHQHRLQAETLAEVTMALASQTDSSDLLDEILRQVARLVPYETANIALVEGDSLRVARGRGYERYGLAQFVNDLVQPFEQYPQVRRAVVQGTAEVVTDTAEHPDWVVIPEMAWIRSHLAIPIQKHSRIQGLLRLDSQVPDQFKPEDAECLRPLANAAAVALENSRLLEDARQRAAELEAVRQATLGLTTHLDLEAVLYAILEATLKLLPGAVDAHIFLYQEGKLVSGAALRSDGRRGRPDSLPRPHGLTHTVAESGEMIVVNSMRNHPLFQNTPADWTGGIIGLPLKIGQRVVGVMNTATEHPHTWPPSDLRLLTLLAGHAAIAVENARLHDEIRMYATELERRVAERTDELVQAAAGLVQREAALSQTAAELQAANASLRQAAVKLQEVDRLKSEFLSNVSHELRTPLSNIKLYLDLIEHGKPGKFPHYLATLQREVNLLQSLIEDLLQISRLDLGKMRPDLQPMSINHFVDNLVGDRMALANSRGLALIAQLAPDLPTVQADRRLLTQVLSNIITNAINYTPADGHIVVRTGLAETEGRAWVTLAVQDSGPGISLEDLPHIFERFYRGAAARQARSPGTGLGLSISEELVHCHGGRITVESQPGRGATFTVWLPLS